MSACRLSPGVALLALSFGAVLTSATWAQSSWVPQNSWVRSQGRFQPRSIALQQYWASQLQSQRDVAQAHPHAQFGYYGQYYGGQTALGYRTTSPRERYNSYLLGAQATSASGLARATCIGPLGIECSSLDCDCDPLDSLY